MSVPSRLICMSVHQTLFPSLLPPFHWNILGLIIICIMIASVLILAFAKLFTWFSVLYCLELGVNAECKLLLKKSATTWIFFTKRAKKRKAVMSNYKRVQQWATFSRAWHMYDATWQDPIVFCRTIAGVLSGKNKPIFHPGSSLLKLYSKTSL